MANINNNNKKSLNRVQLMKENGSNLEFLYIDGIKVGAMGSVNERDREAGIAVIQRIVDNSDKKGMDLVFEVMSQVQFEASMNEKQIEPDEQIEIEGEDCVISYKAHAIYDMYGEELANVNDMFDDELSKVAMKEILKLRAAETLRKMAEDNEMEENEDEEE